KGQTAASSYKPAVLENGVKVSVPQFVNQGDKVVVRISTIEYIERAK
ncbi:MAG: elongation factor P, partial [Alphaproteobacteria bacterium]